MSDRILVYLLIIAATDTAKEWLRRPWVRLAQAVRNLSGGRRGGGGT